MTSPLQGASNGVAVASNEKAKRARASERQDEELDLGYDKDEWLDGRARRLVWGLRYGEKGNELGGFEVYDVVVVLVCDTEVVAAPLRQANTRWKWDFLQSDVNTCYCSRYWALTFTNIGLSRRW